MEREEEAVSLFKSGFACSQSVLSAFAAEFGLDPELALRVSGSFGGGMARQGLTCGAVTGALMALGLRYAKTQVDDNPARERNYAAAQEFIQRFTAEHGSINCNELVEADMRIPESRAAARERGVFDQRCPEYVRSAVRIAGELI